MPETGNAILDILDMQGKLLQNIVNKKETAGSHAFSYDATSLPDGVYIFRLSVNNHVLTRKFVKTGGK